MNLSFTGCQELADKLDKLGAKASGAASAALYVGAGVMADELRAATANLPVDDNPKRPFNGTPLAVISTQDKEDLLNSIGIAKFRRDADVVETKVSFSGYTRREESRLGNVPLPMIARSIESGSSVRAKHPFCRNAAKAAKDKVLAAMQAEIEKQTEG